MKKTNLIITLLVSIFIFTQTIFAEAHASFESEDGKASFSFYGEGSYEEQTDDYTFKDVTSKIKSDSSKLKKINECGILVKAYELKINKNIDYSKYFEDTNFNFEIENENNKALSLIRMTNSGKIESLVEDDHYCEEGICEYSYEYISGDGLFIIIEPINYKYQLFDEIGNIKFNYYKHANYNNNNFIMKNIDEILKNRNIIKQEAEKHGLNYNKILEKMDAEEDGDFYLNDIEESKDEIINAMTINNREYLGMYGFHFVRPDIGISIEDIYSISNFEINLKENKKFKDYTDINVYKIIPYSYIELTSGTFKEDEEYYYYNEEYDEYDYLRHYSNGFIAGEPIDSEYTLVENTSWNYTPAYTKYFSSMFSYYVYDSEQNYYKYINDYNIGDLVSEYGKPVYIYSGYKLTEDTTFQSEKYYMEIDDYGNIVSYVQVNDYKVGQDIKEYEEAKEIKVYKLGMSLEELATGVKTKNGYITFNMTIKGEEEEPPIYIISGVKKEKYTEETEEGSISFEEKPNLTLTFKMDDIKDYSKENIKNVLNLTKEEEYNNIYNESQEKIKNDIIKIYNIEVKDSEGNEYTEGPFNIKIKITDDMKKYKGFKLVNVNSENNKIITGDEIILKEENGYLKGTLNHLSVYALVGTTEEANPNTGDNIIKTLILGIISLIGLISSGLYVNKKRKAKKVNG